MEPHHHTDFSALEKHVRELVASNGSRDERVRAIAAEIMAAGNCRWVGMYEVTPTQVKIIGFSGPGAPAHPVFSRDRGLTGEALRANRTIMVGDVQKDPHYLTAFSTTRSEMIVPVRVDGEIVGTLDVESERIDAFEDDDRAVLERVADALAPLFTKNKKSP